MSLELRASVLSRSAESAKRFVGASFALVGLGLAGAFLVAAKPAHLAESFGPFLSFLVSPWMFATYLLTVVFLAYGFWFLRESPSGEDRTSDFHRMLRRQRQRLLLVFVGCALGLVGVGYWYVLDLEATSRHLRRSEQNVVAKLKAQQVDKWLFDRSIEAESLGASLRQLRLAQLPDGGDTIQIAKVLFGEKLAGNPEWIAVTLLAPDGRVLVNAGEALASEDAARVLQTVTDGKGGLRVIDTGLKNGSDLMPRIHLVLPLMARPGIGPVLAIMDITVDPARELLRQIGKWPTNSPSSEVLLIRRDGDTVVFITPPRHLDPSKAGPLPLRLPLSTPHLIATDAILRGDGAREGRDYRGVAVIAASTRVTGIDWYVVAKTDLDEVLQPLHHKIATLAAVICASILAAGLIVVMLWRGQRAGYLAYRDQQKEERAALSKHFEQSIRASRDTIFLFDTSGNIVDCNEAAVASYGYSVEEFQKLNVRDILPTEEMANLDRHWPDGASPTGHLVEGVHRRRDGTRFPVEISSRSVDLDGKVYRQAVIRDISRRKEMEQQLKRLVRVQKGLSEASAILLRARSEAELFLSMCKVIVDVAGYRLADVAVANHDEGKTVSFVAIAGTDEDYLAQTAITWGEGPRSTGPTGAAIRTGETQVNQNFNSDPKMAPWRDEALKRGLQASIGLPLRDSGLVFGALTIYAEQPDAFDVDEVSMLARFAEDISYGVTVLRKRLGTDAG